MRKIPTTFVRDENFKVTSVWHEDCAWVFRGEGVATEKLDGTNVRLTTRAGTVVRIEKRRNPTKKQKEEWGPVDPWYIDVDPENPTNKWIIEAVSNTTVAGWEYHAYDNFFYSEHVCEAIGPKIQGNPLRLDKHVCVPIWRVPIIQNCTRTFEGLRDYLAVMDSHYAPGNLAEGIVFHNKDGRMAKIKRSDF